VKIGLIKIPTILTQSDFARLTVGLFEMSRWHWNRAKYLVGYRPRHIITLDNSFAPDAAERASDF
jgi:hypothetical protein